MKKINFRSGYWFLVLLAFISPALAEEPTASASNSLDFTQLEQRWGKILLQAPSQFPHRGILLSDKEKIFFAPGLYLAAGLSLIEEDVNLSQVRDDFGGSSLNNVSTGSLPKSDFEEGLGASFQVGFGLNRLLSIEVHVDYLTEISEVNSNNVISSRSEIESHMVTLGVKLGIPLGRIRPYGFFGIGIWNVKYQETATNVSSNLQALRINSDIVESGLKFGAGLEVGLTHFISLYAELQYLKGLGDLDGVNYLLATFGVILRL